MEVLKSELNSTSAYVPADLTKDKLLQRHIDSLTKSNIKIDKIDLPTFYWLPKGTLMLSICTTPHLNIQILSIPFVYESTF